MGVGVELWANGLVRPETTIAEVLMCRALSVSQYIGLRDMASVTEALRIVSAEVGDRLYYEPDLALSQCPTERSRVEYLQRLYGIEASEGEGGYAVVAVKGGCGRGYLGMLERCLGELSADGIRLVFLPMFPKEDLKLSRQLCESYGGVVAEGLSEGDAVGLMKDARVVCGMRLHALVFASAASTPFIGFGGDPKIESFCREHGGSYFLF